MDSATAPSLTVPQFSEWLARLAAGSSSLSATSRIGLRPRSSPARGARGRGSRMKGGDRGSGTSDEEAANNNARTVTLLQWMEVSGGGKAKGIPEFYIPSCSFQRPSIL